MLHDPGKSILLFFIRSNPADSALSHDASVGIGITAGIITGDQFVTAVHFHCNIRIKGKCFRLSALRRAVKVKDVAAVLQNVAEIHRHHIDASAVLKAQAADFTSIDDGLNFGRSLGVKIFAGLQSVSQLSQVYGEERAKVIAAGFMNQFCFYTWDKESRDFIRQRFGDTYMDYMFYDSKGEPVHRQREGHVVEDWDILGLKTGDAYISLIGYDPFFFQFRE